MEQQAGWGSRGLWSHWLSICDCKNGRAIDVMTAAPGCLLHTSSLPLSWGSQEELADHICCNAHTAHQPGLFCCKQQREHVVSQSWELLWFLLVVKSWHRIVHVYIYNGVKMSWVPIENLVIKIYINKKGTQFSQHIFWFNPIFF